MNWREINLDGLVGPTHNYAGLAFGNLASTHNRAAVSHPRAAALQGLEKMKRLMDLGIPQGVLPPQPRPDLATLQRLGFQGSLQQQLTMAAHKAPMLFAACSSASSMWAANAATLAPSCDTLDGRLHLVPANLATHFHRHIETAATHRLLCELFNPLQQACVHDPLPAFADLRDEGAANQMRLGTPGKAGIHLYVYGAENPQSSPTRHYPARQSRMASEAVARLNALPPQNVFFVQQNPQAIDAGAFHNDVVAVSHHHHLFCHELAFVEQPSVLQQLQEKILPMPLHILQVKETEIPLALAIKTYLFNSQIVTTGEGKTCLILPLECEENPQVKNYVEKMVLAAGFVQQTIYVDVRQSMRNGGGPACLRLRILLEEKELAAWQGKALLTPSRYLELKRLIETGYPATLQLEQLQDAHLVEQLNESVQAIRHVLGFSATT